MSGFLLTRDAVDDLDEIWSFIFDDNPEAADAVEGAMVSRCSLISRGNSRPRTWTPRKPASEARAISSATP
jgi:plasmid stabilization system protein ParE